MRPTWSQGNGAVKLVAESEQRIASTTTKILDALCGAAADAEEAAVVTQRAFVNASPFSMSESESPAPTEVQPCPAPSPERRRLRHLFGPGAGVPLRERERPFCPFTRRFSPSVYND
jgi:hypothetical protein